MLLKAFGVKNAKQLLAQLLIFVGLNYASDRALSAFTATPQPDMVPVGAAEPIESKGDAQQRIRERQVEANIKRQVDEYLNNLVTQLE